MGRADLYVLRRRRGRGSGPLTHFRGGEWVLQGRLPGRGGRQADCFPCTQGAAAIEKKKKTTLMTTIVPAMPNCRTSPVAGSRKPTATLSQAPNRPAARLKAM